MLPELKKDRDPPNQPVGLQDQRCRKRFEVSCVQWVAFID
jgi:hypothetical protein